MLRTAGRSEIEVSIDAGRLRAGGYVDVQYVAVASWFHFAWVLASPCSVAVDQLCTDELGRVSHL
jgi:non-canonical (house-cleaning) NTP pyrophosphatase